MPQLRLFDGPVRVCQDRRTEDEQQAEVEVVDAGQKISQREWRRIERKNPRYIGNPRDHQEAAREVDQREQEPGLADPSMLDRKFQAEVDEQGRQKDICGQVRPEDGPVEVVELTRVAKHVKDKRDETHEVKVQRVGRPPAFCDNKNPHQQMQNSDDLEVGQLTLQSLGLRRNHDRQLDRGSITFDVIGRPRPLAEVVKDPGHVPFVLDLQLVNRHQGIAAPYTGPLTGTRGSNQRCLNQPPAAHLILDPQHTIVRSNPEPLLLNVQSAQYDHPQGEDEGRDNSKR